MMSAWRKLAAVMVVAVACTLLVQLSVTRRLSSGPGKEAASAGSPGGQAGRLLAAGPCALPRMAERGPGIDGFLKTVARPRCSRAQPPALASDDTHLYISGDSERDCCYYRLGPNTKIISGCEPIPLTGARLVQEDGTGQEFVLLRCPPDIMYKGNAYEAFVPLKPAVERRCAERAAAGALARPPGEPPVSVLMLGLDSVSRLNLRRQMPRTVALLRGLGAVEMLGYHKVGDNTFPNFLAVFSGKTHSEVMRACKIGAKSPFDDCYFVWKRFEELGYRTMFAEDCPQVAGFYFEKGGFRKAPTDYYFMDVMKPAMKSFGHKSSDTCYRCCGDRMEAEFLLNYTMKFVRRFAGRPSWGLSWSTSISHDEMNALQVLDSDYVAFLERAEAEGLLNDTALVFFSDHGRRGGPFRQTYQGLLEERLPPLWIRLPERWRRAHPETVRALAANAGRLTSAFDLHETLLDLAEPRRLQRTQGSWWGRARGLSLLRPVPEERSCADAGVSDHWCTCHERVPQPADGDTARNASEAFVDFLNRQLEARPASAGGPCAQLQLAETRELLQLLAPRFAAGTSEAEYTVTVRTRPGGALLQTTLRWAAPHWLVRADDVSRLNRYGNQSWCVHDVRLKLFCFCPEPPPEPTEPQSLLVGGLEASDQSQTEPQSNLLAGLEASGQSQTEPQSTLLAGLEDSDQSQTEPQPSAEHSNDTDLQSATQDELQRVDSSPGI